MIAPTQTGDLDDDAILEAYERRVGEQGSDRLGPGDRWVRVNFVTSADGAATLAGRSGGLSDAADKRVFALLRRPCDVIVVGAGTVRAEGYGGMMLDDVSAEWRTEHGYAPQPTLAIVSGNLALDPDSHVFTKAPVRPIVFTTDASPADARERLAKVADVIVCGEASFDTSAALDELAGRGLTRVHCEGGPHLFGTFVRQGMFDELCLTVSRVLEGGAGQRIISGEECVVDLRLEQVLRSRDTLLLRYLQSAQAASSWASTIEYA
ncbi:MAG: pyrimidine reductase family protein [Humibacter sp.]